MSRTALWLATALATAVLVGSPEKMSIEASSSRKVTPNAGSVEAPGACFAAAYHQLDFWIGDWDVFDAAKPGVKSAHVRVTSILGGCVLHEEYEDPTGAKGESFSIYDATRKVWHQTWVTNHGRLLMIEGHFEGNEMVLEGADLTADGKQRHVRGVWMPVSEGVRETAVTSLDGGKTWQPWFDLLFRKASSRP